MPYARHTQETESDSGIEITPKREKAWLAAAYAATVATGLNFYRVKDDRPTSCGSVFTDDGLGHAKANEMPNLDFYFSTALFVAATLALLCIKIRIWWRHY